MVTFTHPQPCMWQTAKQSSLILTWHAANSELGACARMKQLARRVHVLSPGMQQTASRVHVLSPGMQKTVSRVHVLSPGMQQTASRVRGTRRELPQLVLPGLTGRLLL